MDAARKVLEYLAQEENVKALCAAVFAPSGFLNIEADLGSLNEYYTMWKDVKNVGQFDRTYMPNGVYDTWADATSKVLMGSYTPDEDVYKRQALRCGQALDGGYIKNADRSGDFGVN